VKILVLEEGAEKNKTKFDSLLFDTHKKETWFLMTRQEKNKFLLLDVELKEPPGEGDTMVADTMNGTFSDPSCSFEIQNDKIVFYLHSMDLDLFRERLRKIIADVKREVPVHEHEFEEIIKKIEAIGSYGVKSGRRIYVGYNKERKVQERKAKVARRKSFYYALDNTFSRTNNQIPEEFENKIICADSEDILKKLPDNCVDLVFTSPPYNFGLGYDAWEDGVHWEDYFNKLFAVFDECIRVLKYGGRIAVNVQPLFSDYIPSHQIIANYLMQKKLIWKGEILWEKNNYNCKYTAWGSWKSPSSPYLKYTWEFIEVFSKGDVLKPGSSDDIDITSDEFKKWVVAKWSVAPERNMKKYDHPAMFPEELVERVLKLFSYQNDVILDPFNGAGTTTVVAKKTKRRYLGIDISEDYCKKSELRLKEVLQSYVNL
jgi:DNA modification methylase